MAPFPGGASARRDRTGWVLGEDAPRVALGGALAWARRHDVDELHVMVASQADEVARQAEAFAGDVTVWTVRGTALERAEPSPPPEPARADERALRYAGLLARAGARPWVEFDGTVIGEVLGLEMARVVDNGGDLALEVGVGKHDREAHRELLDGDEPTLERVRAVVRDVRTRRLDPRHPLSRVSRERWLAEVVCRRPEWVGADDLERRPALVTRDDLRERAPAPAVGDGVVVVCSVGLDPQLVPIAADVRTAYAPDARLVLLVPEGDDHSSTRALAARLRSPAEVVTVGEEWKDVPVD